MAILILLLLLTAPAWSENASGERPLPSSKIQFVQMRDSTAISGTQKDTSEAKQVAGATIFSMWVRARGRATADTTHLKFFALLSPDGKRFGARIVLDSLVIYGTRADTLWKKQFSSNVINNAVDAKLVTESSTSTNDTTDVRVWWNMIWTSGMLF